MTDVSCGRLSKSIRNTIPVVVDVFVSGTVLLFQNSVKLHVQSNMPVWQLLNVLRSKMKIKNNRSLHLLFDGNLLQMSQLLSHVSASMNVLRLSCIGQSIFGCLKPQCSGTTEKVPVEQADGDFEPEDNQEGDVQWVSVIVSVNNFMEFEDHLLSNSYSNLEDDYMVETDDEFMWYMRQEVEQHILRSTASPWIKTLDYLLHALANNIVFPLVTRKDELDFRPLRELLMGTMELITDMLMCGISHKDKITEARKKFKITAEKIFRNLYPQKAIPIAISSIKDDIEVDDGDLNHNNSTSKIFPNLSPLVELEFDTAQLCVFLSNRRSHPLVYVLNKLLSIVFVHKKAISILVTFLEFLTYLNCLNKVMQISVIPPLVHKRLTLVMIMQKLQ